MFVIVPDSLYDRIQAKLDEAFKKCPDAEKDREHLYHQLLSYYDDNGTLPDFSLSKAEKPE